MCHDGIWESGRIVSCFFTLTVGGSEPIWTLLRREKLLLLLEIERFCGCAACCLPRRSDTLSMPVIYP